MTPGAGVDKSSVGVRDMTGVATLVHKVGDNASARASDARVSSPPEKARVPDGPWTSGMPATVDPWFTQPVGAPAWDAELFRHLLRVAADQDYVGAYIERNHAHLLRVYEKAFLRDLVLSGGATHLVGNLEEAEHPGGADRVRREHAARRVPRDVAVGRGRARLVRTGLAQGVTTCSQPKRFHSWSREASSSSCSA